MKRAFLRTDAVVLSSFDFKESDRVLTLYTEGFGKVKGIARGARRSRRRFVGNLDPASLVRVVLFHNGKSEFSGVEEASLLNPFKNLKSDLERLSLGYYLLELTNELTRPWQVTTGVFELLKDFLMILDSGGDGALCERFFEIRMLRLMGYMPHLTGCVLCKGRLDGERVIFFSSEKGGALCGGCAPGREGLIPLSPGTASLLALASRLPPGKLGRLKPGGAFLREGEAVLADFIRYHVGKRFKTKDFLAKLKTSEATLE